MRDIAIKVDDVGDTLSAPGFNANQDELENVITTADDTLDPAGGPDTDLFMLSKAIAGYAGASWAYQDSGSANAYVLSIASNLKPITKYFDNMMVAFKPGNDNTGASTVNVAGLGVKSIKIEGSDPVAGEISAVKILILKYNDSADYFEIVAGAGTIDLTLIGAAASPPDANTLVKDNIVKGWIKLNGTGTVSIDDSYNVSSIVDNGTGNYDVVWDRNFTDDRFAAVGSSGTNTTPAISSDGSGNGLRSIVRVYNVASGAAQDSEEIYIIAMGDQ